MARFVSDLCDREYFGMKLGLTKIRRVLKRLKHPEKKFPVIHVAGTNGKGSTSTMIARILEAADLKVGLFTSPHLHHITERFLINGVPVSVSRLERLLAQVEAADDKGAQRLSFFEMMTALAFLYFAEDAVDIAVIETGLGGRLDATNVVTPLASVITPISYDHQKHLGTRLEQIAGEKAGIIKRAVPVVSAPQEPGVQKTLVKAAKNKAASLTLVESPRISADGRFQVDGFCELWTPNLGRFQATNAAVAVKVVQALMPKFRVSRKAIRAGLAATYLPGHMEIVQRNPLILLDVAHNPAAMESLVAASCNLFKSRRIHCLFAAMQDKDVRGMLRTLRQLQPILYLTRPHLKRAMSLDELTKLSDAEGLQSMSYADPAAALADFQSRVNADRDALLVTGSLFLVAEARDHLLANRRAA